MFDCVLWSASLLLSSMCHVELFVHLLLSSLFYWQAYKCLVATFQAENQFLCHTLFCSSTPDYSIFLRCCYCSCVSDFYCDLRARHQSMVHQCPKDQSVVDQSIVDLSIVDFPKLQINPLQISPLQISLLQISPLQISPLQISPLQINPLQISPLQISLLQISCRLVRCRLVSYYQLLVYQQLLVVFRLVCGR